MIMIARVLSLRAKSGLAIFPIFRYSVQLNKTDILSSQFHSHGIRHFLKSKQLNRASTSTIYEIDKLITQLEKHRMRVAQVREGELIKQEELGSRPECGKYFETYLKLVEKMSEVKFKEEWRYRVVGWYNMQPFLQDLIDQLLGQADKSAHGVLIESIHWMKPHQIVYKRDESVQELIKQKMRLDHFYRQLNYGVGVDTLRQIQGIFGDFVTQCKSKYYHHYLQNSINTLLSQDSLDDLLWIFEMYVATFNDDTTLITQIQQHLLTLPLTNSDKIARSLIRIHNQFGRINKQIFTHFIKPFLATTPNIIQVQIMNLEFIVHSEVDDEEALNSTLKQIAKIARTQPISDGHRLHVHYLLHYLKIKDIKFAFPPTINREFNEACRTFEEDGTLAKLIAIQLDQRSRREGIDHYNSSCVLKKKHYDFSANRGQQIKKVEGFRKFTNVKFCCLKLDLCVYEQAKKKAVVLEKNYHRFQHSGNLIRMEQVKADILKHYGFDINYLQPKAETKNI